MTVLKQYLGGPLGLSLYVFMLQTCNITPLEKKPANGSLRSWRGRTTRKMLHFGGVRRCGGKRHSVSLPPPRLLKSKCTPPDMRQRKGGGVRDNQENWFPSLRGARCPGCEGRSRARWRHVRAGPLPAPCAVTGGGRWVLVPGATLFSWDDPRPWAIV